MPARPTFFDVIDLAGRDGITKALKVLSEIIESQENVLKSPNRRINQHELADSSVNFIVRPWSQAADYWDVYRDITRQVKERFDAQGILMTFPQQDVHMHQA